jgi:cyclic pyranopterin phosphate synthase
METGQTGDRLTDPYGRNVNSLRISVTQRCDLNCFFCHQEGESNPHGEMAPGEIEAIVSTAADLGVRKIKLTGGEPLLREDIIEIVGRISSHVEEVSMTTNALHLVEKAGELREAGLQRVNVSLHSACPEVFEEITGWDVLTEVEEGIKAALRAGLKPVKLNMVVMRGVNDEEIPRMIEFAKDLGVTLHYHYDLRPLEEELESRSERIVEREMHRRRQYHLRDGGVVEVVRPMHNSLFCAFCTRLRLTSDGYLKPCLMLDDNHIDAVSLLRNGAGREALVAAIREAVSNRKPYWVE